jgi:hypothetical protein
MKEAGGFYVSIVRFLWGFEVTEPNAVAMSSYLAVPPLISFMPLSAFQSCAPRALRFAVPLVVSLGRVAKIAPAIVGAVIIDVVDLVRRFLTRHHLPDDAMGFEDLFINADNNIALLFCLHDHLALPTAKLTDEYAGHRVIGIPAFQKLDRWYRLEFGHRTGSNGSFDKWWRKLALPLPRTLAEGVP